MTGKATVLLEHHLKFLKLPTIKKEYQEIAARCAKENGDYASFLLRLVEREVIERQNRAMQRRIKAAKFPIIKTIDNFNFKAQPSIKSALIKQLVYANVLTMDRYLPGIMAIIYSDTPPIDAINDIEGVREL